MAWTTHFVGGGESKRDLARHALCRAELASRMFPLFPEEDNKIYTDTTHGYFQILHAGYNKVPESIVAVVPSTDQTAIRASMSLPITQPTIAEVEQVKEEMHIKIVRKDAHVEQDYSAG